MEHTMDLLMLNEKDLISREQDATQLPRLFRMWRKRLLGWMYTIFEWSGLAFPQVELERLVMLNGFGFIAFNKAAPGGMVTAVGGLSGVTPYPDVFKNVTFAVPGDNAVEISGTYDIGKNAAVLWNTSAQSSVLPLIERYASLLAHMDITIKLAAVNQRLNDTLVASDDAQRESIRAWYKSIYRGANAVIMDKQAAILENGDIKNIYQPTPRVDIRNLIEAENEILRQFYRDIGIRSSKEKKAELTSAEVNDATPLLMFNVSDMLNQRTQFAEECNRMAGTNISVKLSDVYTMYDEVTGNDGIGVSGAGDAGNRSETD